MKFDALLILIKFYESTIKLWSYIERENFQSQKREFKKQIKGLLKNSKKFIFCVWCDGKFNNSFEWAFGESLKGGLKDLIMFVSI